MFINYQLLPCIVTGIAGITLLATFGAILSRKLSFNYGLLSPVGFGIYLFIGFLVAKNNSLDIVLACNILIGMFDAIIGWNCSMKLKANTGAKQRRPDCNYRSATGAFYGLYRQLFWRNQLYARA